MIKVEELTTAQKFLEIREEWNCLLSKCRSDSFFMSWDWLYNWWQFYGSGMDLKILLLRQDGKLRGIAPLCISFEKISRMLNFIGYSHVGSDCLDFIFYKNFEEALLERFFLYIREEFKEWDIFTVTDLPPNSMTTSYVRTQKIFTMIEQEPRICPYLSLPDTWEDLERSFGSNLRYDTRRKKRKFINEFNGKFVEITDIGDLDRAFASMLRLSAARFKEKGLTSPFEDKRFRGFHRKLMSDLFNKDMLRLFTLNIDGKDIAFLYNFKYLDSYLFYQSGFSPRWGKISPGVVIFTLSIEKAIQEGMKEFDFLRGDEAYKKRWTKEFRKNNIIQLFNSGVKNDVMRRAMSMSSNIKRTIKKMVSVK